MAKDISTTADITTECLYTFQIVAGVDYIVMITTININTPLGNTALGSLLRLHIKHILQCS